MRRPFTDSAFQAFLLSDTLLARSVALDSALQGLKKVDVTAAAGRALAYLPRNTRLQAKLYLEIKPIPNSFVFTGADSVRSIFLYVEVDETPAQLENTLAHELHHIGMNTACTEPAYSKTSPAEKMLLRFLGAFGEGEAMLAAAGSPNVHPHVADADSIQRRWDRDVARAQADMAEMSQFFTAVLEQRVTSADSVLAHASTYFGVQGPWYTVGWLMASTVERALGRKALIADMCEPLRLMADYNRSAATAKRVLPRWPDDLVRRLAVLRAAE